MREVTEFRLKEEFASLLFKDSEGVRLGSGLIRSIKLSTEDPRYLQVGELHKRLQLELDDVLFQRWIIRRHYSEAELDAAKFFSVLSPKVRNAVLESSLKGWRFEVTHEV